MFAWFHSLHSFGLHPSPHILLFFIIHMSSWLIYFLNPVKLAYIKLETWTTFSSGITSKLCPLIVNPFISDYVLFLLKDWFYFEIICFVSVGILTWEIKHWISCNSLNEKSCFEFSNLGNIYRCLQDTFTYKLLLWGKN